MRNYVAAVVVIVLRDNSMNLGTDRWHFLDSALVPVSSGSSNLPRKRHALFSFVKVTDPLLELMGFEKNLTESRINPALDSST